MEIKPKPVLGLKPRSIHDQDRASEILAAMTRYVKDEKAIPDGWFDELMYLNSNGNGCKDKKVPYEFTGYGGTITSDRKQAQVKPKQVVGPDLFKLREVCQQYIDDIDQRGMARFNDNPLDRTDIMVEALKAVYGANIWKWVNDNKIG